MKITKRLLSLMMVFAMVLTMCGALAGCGKKTDGDKTADTTVPATTAPGATEPAGESAAYSVTVKTAGGMAMEGIAVSVFKDEALTDLQGYSQTDALGVAAMQLPKDGTYYISLSGVPKGYDVQSQYSFSGNAANITLTSSLVMGENLAETTLGLGDVMYDFTVTTPGGNQITLSEILKEKDMVLLNFWYSTCGPCVNEFPFLERAYQMYKDDVEVLALNSYPLDDDTSVGAFQASMGLSFPMAKVPDSWANTFGITGYPTSFVVDRNGVIVLKEVGSLPSLRPFTSIFETLTADDYQQKLYNSVSEIVVTPKPTFEMPASEEIAEVLGTTELPITFRAEEGESGEYTWPFVVTTKNDEQCLMASNQYVEESYAIIYADVTLEAGQALGFDFLRSTETGADIMYVIVDGQDINAISGFFVEERWESCYPLVAEEAGTYEVAFCYLKDAETDAGDDTVYIKNMRIVDESEIDSVTYLPKKAALSEDGFTYSYVDIVLNDEDGYYHVGSEDGPLLLIDLMNTTDFTEEESIWILAYNGDIIVDGVDYAEQIEKFSLYANNSNLAGVSPVNQQMYEVLMMVDQAVGFDEADNMEWMKACKYYQPYGTNEQLENPIKGLNPQAAYKAKLGKNIPTNMFTYNRQLVPRGLYAEFVPSRSGVYRITSRNEAPNGVLGWIFSENQEILYDSDKFLERSFDEAGEVTMVFYMQSGTPYYINIAFCDPAQLGDIYYDIEYVGSSYSLLICCSPGAYTYDTDASGNAMNYTIAPGIDVVLGSDGIYYHDLGDGKKGSKIYLDFVNSTPAFPNAALSTVGSLKGLIDRGYFDFSKTADDNYIILNFLKPNDYNAEKALEDMRKTWGEDFDTMYAEYQAEDVLAGIYHGKGEDYTDFIRGYEKKMIKGGELNGCVVVDEELAEVLQILMDHYAFEGVETSWRKLCYYYYEIG